VPSGRGAVCPPGRDMAPCWGQSGGEAEYSVNPGRQTLFGTLHHFRKRNLPGTFRPPAAARSPSLSSSKAGEVTRGDHV